MATIEPPTLNMFPSVNDVAAGFVVFMVYVIRIAAGATPAWSEPWYLLVVTDAILPVLAAAWLWLYAMYLLRER